MSACLSSPIALLAARGGLVHDSAQTRAEDLVAPDLLVALLTVADPRHARGVRHRLVTVLAAAVCAVLAGARAYVGIAEWAHDLPVSVRVRIGIGRRTPSESTFRRVLQSVDADELAGWCRAGWPIGPPQGRCGRSRLTARPLAAPVRHSGPMAAARPGAMNANECQRSRPSNPLGSIDLHICRSSCVTRPVHRLAPGSRQSQMSGWLRLMTCQIGWNWNQPAFSPPICSWVSSASWWEIRVGAPAA